MKPGLSASCRVVDESRISRPIYHHFTIAIMAQALRRSFVEASSAAALGFASVLAMGALLVVTWKLAFPAFASGASPVVVLTYIVLAGLMCLGVPVEQAGRGSTLLPLGGVAAVGGGVVWGAPPLGWAGG